MTRTKLAALMILVGLSTILAQTNASMYAIGLRRPPATDFVAYGPFSQNWTCNSNFGCTTVRFALTLPAGNWAVFMDEDMSPPVVTYSTITNDLRAQSSKGIDWTRISRVWTGPTNLTVDLAVPDTGPWFFRLQRL